MINTIVVDEKSDDFSLHIDMASQLLLESEVVIFPTETVYGIGAVYSDELAVKKIYNVKGRPSDNPLIVHVSSLDMALELISDDFDKELFLKLAEAFWPGPLSMIVKKSDLVPHFVTGGLDTVAIRMPRNRVALELIKRVGKPLAAPSANISGLPSGTRRDHLIADFNKKLQYIFTSDMLPIGLESTVLDLSAEPIMILRPGAVTKTDISRVTAFPVGIYKSKKEFVPKSPGLKYKHYSPNALVYMLPENYKFQGFELLQSDLGVKGSDVYYLDYKDSNSMAQNLYADFRLADKLGYKYVAVKPCVDDELGLAALNRLIKACENKEDL